MITTVDTLGTSPPISTDGKIAGRNHSSTCSFMAGMNVRHPAQRRRAGATPRRALDLTAYLVAIADPAYRG